jgi:threonylcarbamoyladenosine tRNA methylthiotransferase MtaB
VIVGFPGEADSDFERSAAACRESGFIKIHAFPFSPRPKTAAARWQRQFVPAAIISERMRVLANIETENSFAFRRALLGRVERVIVEQRGDAASNGLACGRSDRYVDVWFDREGAMPGDLVRVQIERVTPTRTHGRALYGPGCDQRLFVLSDSVA